MLRWLLLLGVCALAGAWLTGCAVGGTEAHARDTFYRASTTQIVGIPGSIIRMEAMEGAPSKASAFRILYRSIGLYGEPIAVSGVVVVPADTPPASGRPILAWAHPTSGIVPRCAPSLALFLFQDMPGLRDMLARGYVVVATDYPGLGTLGPHPYLVGVSEGRAVLDSVRAAARLPAASAGNRFVVWGHSQGGQAALFAGLLWHDYAPELSLTGVAATAPATDLETLLRDDFDSDGGRNLTAMTLWSWTRVFGIPLDGVVAPAAMPAVDALASECIESVYDMFARKRSQGPLANRFLEVKDITQVEPWRSLLRQNIPGVLPRDIPVFLAQGDADDLVRPQVTTAYKDALCAAGSRVRMLNMAGVGHGFAGFDSAKAAVEWMGARLAGQPAPSDCTVPTNR
jgi:acetyl esterase/lipase